MIFIIGDDIIYWDKDGSQWPGKILDIHRVYPRIKIIINYISGDRIIWVKPKNLKHQGG